MSGEQDCTEFKKELDALKASKPPVSASKISTLTKLAVKHVEKASEVALYLKEFMQEVPENMILSGLYAIDSISRAASKDAEGGQYYLKIFEEMIVDLVPQLLKIPDTDKIRVKRTLLLWIKSKIFSKELISNIIRVNFSDVPQKDAKNHQSTDDGGNPELQDMISQLINKLGQSNLDDNLLQKLQSMASSKLDQEQQQSIISHIKTLLGDLEQNPEGRAIISKSLSLLPLLLKTDQHDKTQYDKKSQKSTLDQEGKQRTTKSKHKQDSQNSSSIPTVLASSVPFGKTQDKPAQDSLKTPFQYFQTQGGIASIGNPEQQDYSTFQDHNSWKWNRINPHMQYRGRYNTGELPGDYPNNNRSPLYPDDEPQGKPIPVFDSERCISEKENSHPPQQVPHSLIKPNEPGSCIAGYIDPYLPKKYFKVLTRTVYIGGITQNITKEMIRDIFETITRVDTVTVNYLKFNAFVKLLTRAEAELAREYFQDFHWKGTVLKMGWGCGYGPKEYFDYNTGETIFPISRMTDTEKRIISYSIRGGGPIIGGMVVEEPDFGWPQKGDVCHGEYTRGQVPYAPGYLRTLEQRKRCRAQSEEFSANELMSKDLLHRFGSIGDPGMGGWSGATNGMALMRQQPQYYHSSYRQQHMMGNSRKRGSVYTVPLQQTPTTKEPRMGEGISPSGVSSISVVSDRKYIDDNYPARDEYNRPPLYQGSTYDIHYNTRSNYTGEEHTDVLDDDEENSGTGKEQECEKAFEEEAEFPPSPGRRRSQAE